LVVDAYHNAMAEAFFATPDCELLYRHSFGSQAEARMAMFAFTNPSTLPAVTLP